MAVIVQSVHCQCKGAARQHLMDKVGGGEDFSGIRQHLHMSHIACGENGFSAQPK